MNELRVANFRKFQLASTPVSGPGAYCWPLEVDGLSGKLNVQAGLLMTIRLADESGFSISFPNCQPSCKEPLILLEF